MTSTTYKLNPGGGSRIATMSIRVRRTLPTARALAPSVTSAQFPGQLMAVCGYISCDRWGGTIYNLSETTVARCGEHAPRRSSFRYASYYPLSALVGHPLIKLLDTQLWANIYSAEITSSEYLSKIRSLFNCPSKIAAARSLRGNEAQTFIDFLDQASLSRGPCLDNLGRRT